MKAVEKSGRCNLNSDLAINVENLTKRYGDLMAVNGISFDVKKGEIFAFLGPNGAGKTTTVEILVGLRKATNGGATVLGFDIAKDRNEIKKRIGVLPQSFNTYDRLTVKENIEYFAGLFDCSPDVDGLIKLVDLEDKKKEQFRNLSGGLKQRLGIAVALVNDPEVVFLDEPTSGLDPKARHGVWRLIEDLHAEGKTVFLTTHYMEEAEALADRVGIIHYGRIVALDEKDKLIAEHGKKNLLVLRKADPKAVSIIGKLGLKAKHDESEDEVIIHLNHAVAVSNIMQALSTAHVSFSELQLKRSSLEDVFLNLTGEELGKEDVA
jgi:ABC-2 type transport system ATP-binding protein